MTLQSTMFSTLARGALAAIILFTAAACGGGGSESDVSPPPSSLVADSEAGRIATLYRYTQGLAGLMLSTLTEVDIGESRAGTRACGSGGTVTYSDSTPNPAADPEALVTFNNCREADATIDGTLQVKNLIVRLNPDGSGTFNVIWSTNVSIDGYSMTFESASGFVTRSAAGRVHVETFGGQDNALRLSAPDGRSVQFSDVRIALAYDPASAVVDFGGSDVQMRSIETSDLNAVLRTNGLSAPASNSASGVASIGLPQSGSLSYRRSFDATATDLAGAGSIGGGLLNLTIDSLPAKYRFPGSAGQYVWSSILANPEFSLPNSSP